MPKKKLRSVKTVLDVGGQHIKKMNYVQQKRVLVTCVGKEDTLGLFVGQHSSKI